MKITTVGIDLAKNLFQVHGVNEHGKAVLKKQLRRDQVAEFFAQLPPCLIGMEACGSAHYWARKLGEKTSSAHDRQERRQSVRFCLTCATQPRPII